MSVETKPKKKRAKSGPAKCYVYGAREPITERERVLEQFWMAHKYKNALIAVERDRRTATDNLTRKVCPELLRVEAEVDQVDAAIKEMQTAIKSRRTAETGKAGGTPDEKRQVREQKAKRRNLFARRKELRAEVFGDEKARTEFDAIDETAKSAVKSLRATSGALWGTRGIIEDSLRAVRKGAPPKFKRREPGGTLSVQTQCGMTAAEVYECESNLFRIEPVADDAYTHISRGYRRRAAKTKAWIRVGSIDTHGIEKRGGQTPIWCVVPITMHRPLPEDARIKRVKLIETRVGTHYKWQLNVSLEYDLPQVPDDVAQDGAVGIDVGWRMTDSGGILVATYVGSDGHTGTLELPDTVVRRFAKVRELQSIRDKTYGDVLDTIVAWKKVAELPEWIATALSHVHQWRSQARLAGLWYRWRDARFGGDEAIYEIVSAWRNQDKHLYDWQEHQRKSTIRHRRELYRLFAVDMRRRYAIAVIEKIDHKKAFQDLPPAEDGDDMAALARQNRVVVALSHWTSAIDKSGMRVVRIPPAHTSTDCHSCGYRNSELGADREWTCLGCGMTHDRDDNAARNILAASGEVAPIS